MKYKIFEEKYKCDLEEELNDFAKNNDIQQISITNAVYGFKTYYTVVVAYIPKQEEAE